MAISIHLGYGQGIHIGAVLENGHGIADFDYFLQTVGNVDHADAAFLEFAYKPEQYFHLVILQEGRGFVQNDKLDVVVNGDLADGNHGLHGDGQLADLGAGIDLHFKLVDYALAFLRHPAPVHQTVLFRLAAQEIVFGNAQVGSDGNALVVGKHAVRLAFHGAAVGDPFTVVIHGDGSLILVFHAHDAFDQRGFSRAILAAQRVNFSLFDLKAHVVQRCNAGIEFADVLDFQNRVLQMFHPHFVGGFHRGRREARSPRKAGAPRGSALPRRNRVRRRPLPSPHRMEWISWPAGDS